MKKYRISSIGSIVFDIVMIVLFSGIFVMFLLLPNIFPAYGMIGAGVLIALSVASLVIKLHFKLVFNLGDYTLLIVHFSSEKVELVNIDKVSYISANGFLRNATVELEMKDGKTVVVPVAGFRNVNSTKKAMELAQVIADFSAYAKQNQGEGK